MKWNQPSRARSDLRSSLVGAALALSTATTTGHAGPDLVRPRTAVHVALRPYFRGLRTVEVRVAGISRSFLVDTAGGRTLLTPAMAASLGCAPRGRAVGYRMNGDPVV